jgi:hypothetical protein
MKIFGAKNVEYFVRKRTDWCKMYLKLNGFLMVCRERWKN